MSTMIGGIEIDKMAGKNKADRKSANFFLSEKI